MDKYRQALRYGFKCSRLLGADLVHEAFVMNYRKDGSNLFDKEIFTILNFVKYAWLTERRKIQYMYHGEIKFRAFEELVPSSATIPADDFSDKQFEELILSKIRNYKSSVKNNSIDPDRLVNVYHLLMSGYDTQEIAKRMEISGTTSRYYKNKLKSIIGSMTELTNSPFNGNPLKVRRVTRPDYEKHKEDKYSEFEYNTDKYSDINEYYEQKSHKTESHGILIVESKRLDL
jgi:hypothetical protein